MAPSILIFGLPRTGTQSLCDALVILGYKKVYHMREVGANGHFEAWAKLLHAKEEGKGLTRSDFDLILGEWDSTADVPSCAVPLELMAAYPDAKIVITERTEDSWIASMTKSVVAPSILSRQDQGTPMREAYRRILWQDDFDANGRRCWREYQQMVRQAASDQGRSIHVQSLGDGWEKLCQFLGRPVPEVGYPNNDDARNTK